jgi:hypothetical protein
MCPACRSQVKSERLMVDTYYGVAGRAICTNNWHWAATPLSNGTTPPRGWDWNADDDRFLWLMDIAFQKPRAEIMDEYKYLRP